MSIKSSKRSPLCAMVSVVKKNKQTDNKVLLSFPTHAMAIFVSTSFKRVLCVKLNAFLQFSTVSVCKKYVRKTDENN